VDALRGAAVLIEEERLLLHWHVADLRVDALVVVEEDVEDAVLAVLEQIRQRDPSLVLEVLRLVHDDGIEQLVPVGEVRRLHDQRRVEQDIGGLVV